MSDDNQLDVNSPEIQALIDAKAEEKVQGLKANRDEILGKYSKLKEVVSQYSDVDLEEYRAFKQKIAQDETAKLIAEGKIDDVVNQRVQAMAQDYEQKLNATIRENELYKSQVLNGHIATAAAQAGVDKDAIDLVALLAQQSGVKLDANGNPVVTDAEGNVRYSKDGITPLSLNDWLNSLRETKSILWGLPVGSGARSNLGGQGQKKPEDMTAQERAELHERDPELFRKTFLKKD